MFWEAKIVCKSFLNPSLKLHFCFRELPGGAQRLWERLLERRSHLLKLYFCSREATGGKELEYTKTCKNILHSFIKIAVYSRGGPGRLWEALGKKAVPKLYVNPFRIFH